MNDTDHNLKQEWYQAILDRDESYEGIFFVAVKTTGIFCRPVCRARKPKFENVEFYTSSRDALAAGFRPCRVCHPLEYAGAPPDWLRPLQKRIEDEPDRRWTDAELKELGVDPNRVRRWFKAHHRITFHGYLRMLRIGRSHGRIREGKKVIDAAFDAGYDSLSGFGEAFTTTVGSSPVQARQQGVILYRRLATPLGPMLAAAVDDGVCLLEFGDRRALEQELQTIQKRFRAPMLPGDHPLLDRLEQQLTEYFAGKRTEFDLPLALAGTPFQEQVWRGLLAIPYGQTRSYAEQAEALGNPKAVRAVARANGQNRIAIIIPCHRVIGSDGRLVGYGGGLRRKEFLLKLEGVFLF